MTLTSDAPTPDNKPIFLLTGAMAAGKTTVAQRLAQRLDPSVHLRGDLYRRMIVRGRVDMSAEPSAEAMRQLRLRYHAAAQTAKQYSAAGFNVVYQDVIIGDVLPEVVALYEDYPLHVFVLCPDPEVIAQRERDRGKTGYGAVSIQQLQQALADTPRIGHWIDSSEHKVEDTIAAVLDNLSQAKI